MEALHFSFTGGDAPATARPARLVGVVASGNLEVMIEPSPRSGACTIDVNTAAEGFGSTWNAVLQDFFERHRLRDVRLSINDAGATPATVALRLDQAVEAYRADDDSDAGHQRS